MKSVKQNFDEVSDNYVKSYTKPSSVLDYEKIQRMKTAVEFAGDIRSNKILDVGTGSGEFMKQMLQKSNADIYAMDISSKMLRVNKIQNRDVAKIQANTYSLPFKSGVFDLISCLGVLGYINDEKLEKTMKEYARILKPNGNVIFSFANSNSPFRKVRQFHNNTILPTAKRVTGLGNLRNYRYKSYPVNEIQNTLAASGLEIINKKFLTYSSGLGSDRLNLKSEPLAKKICRASGHKEYGMSCIILAAKNDC